jgi:hypothetical protein
MLTPLGSEIERFSLPGRKIDALSWSPDSQQLVVAVDAPSPASKNGDALPAAHGQSALLVINRHGGVISELKPVGGDGSGIWDVDWSPDGSTIAYIAARWRPKCCTFDFTLELVRPDGTGIRSLAPAGGCFCAGIAPGGVAWAPDGTLIAYGSAGDGLYVIRPDGTGKRRVSDATMFPAWRPVP